MSTSVGTAPGSLPEPPYLDFQKMISACSQSLDVGSSLAVIGQAGDTNSLDSSDFRMVHVVARRLLSSSSRHMGMTKWVTGLAVFALTLPVLPSTSYTADRNDVTGSTGVVLYEVSERVTFEPDPGAAGVIRRNATSPLQGFAALGTPLCPAELLVSVPRIASCTVIATGTDSVSTVTGVGPVGGTFDVVINAPGNSSVHVPDLPVIHGTFTGDVNLKLAVVEHIPLGSITGSFTITDIADPVTGILVRLVPPVVLPFSGTFRMPFKLDPHGRFQRSERNSAAFYLADDFRTLIPVRAFERSTGFPTVRLEVSFGP